MNQTRTLNKENFLKESEAQIHITRQKRTLFEPLLTLASLFYSSYLILNKMQIGGDMNALQAASRTYMPCCHREKTGLMTLP